MRHAGATVSSPAERWYDSFHDTIREVLARPMPELAPGSDDAAMLEMVHEVIVGRSFGGELGDRAHAPTAYERHNREVQGAFGADRLLVYDVAEGWEPLCRLLDRPVPAEPFPNVNDRAFFRSRFLGEGTLRPEHAAVRACDSATDIQHCSSMPTPGYAPR